MSELAQLAYFSEQGHQALGVIYHQYAPFVNVHELPTIHHEWASRHTRKINL